MRGTAVLASALLLSVTACGGDDKPSGDAPLTADEKKAVASITAYWKKAGIEDDAAKCLGNRMVKSFGVDHLQDLKLLDDSFEANDAAGTVFSSKTDAPKAAAMIVDCRGLATLMKQQYTGIDDKAADCLATVYGRDRMVSVITATLEGQAPPETPQDVTVEMGKCVPNQ